MSSGLGPGGGEVGNVAWSSERNERGHGDEEKVFGIFQQIGVSEVRRDQVGRDPGVEFAYARSTSDEDWNQGIDCYFYSGYHGKWLKMDITTDMRPSHWNWERSRHGVDVVLAIPHNTIDRASRGAYRDMEKIFDALDEALP